MGAKRFTPPFGGESQTQLLERERKRFRERRREARVAPPTDIGWIQAEDGSDAWHPVQVFDVSPHGVGFRTSAVLAHGSCHQLRIGNGTMKLSSRIRIVHLRTADPTHRDYGAEFC